MTEYLRRPPGDGPERLQQDALRRAQFAMAIAGAQTDSLSHSPTLRRFTADVANPVDARVAETSAALADGVPSTSPQIPAWHLPASTTEEVMP